METAGLWMLAAVAVTLITTGLPAFIVLIGVAVTFSAFGMIAGIIPYALLTALPARIIGFLENDLLQALPLYVLMGALLNRLPLADILFRAGNRAFARTPAAPLLSGMALGAMLAPMNGSVGASVATLSRIVQPKLLARGIPGETSLATVCVASTLGVVVPPSLVLILFGDTMMRAHTEALNVTGQMTRIINTQDVFRGALTPAAIFLALALVLAWWTGRREAPAAAAVAIAPERVASGEWLVACGTALFIVGLLTAVTLGYIYAVEAAAAGAFALTLFGLATRTLHGEALADILRSTMAVTGALFALFVAATTFTLVFRAFGTDQLLAVMINAIPGGAIGAVLAVLLLLGLCALVLDAFEIILVIIPVLMPPLLLRVPDAVWASVLAMLALQASFLIPPFGYAVMMARAPMAEHLPFARVGRSLAPFLCAQALVLGLTIAFPAIAHFAASGAADDMALKPVLNDEQVRKLLDNLPSPDDAAQ